MTARCDLTELLVTACACKRCRNIADPAVATTGEMGPWFDARHDGTCAGCKEPIEAGQRIRATGTGYGYYGECCGSEDS